MDSFQGVRSNLSPAKDKVFREIYRVLKPGGRVSISDIVVQDLSDWVREDVAAYIGCVAGAISETEYVKGLRDAGLSPVGVEGRLVYELEQIHAIVESDLGDVVADPELIDKGLAEVEGKVWSARFEACKPATSSRSRGAILIPN